MGLKEAGLRGSLRNVSETTPAFYDVQITGTNEPITEGDTLDVNYQVQNTEDQDGIKDVFLEIDTVEEDRDSNISLSGGATATGTLQWVTQNGEAGTYNAVVLSPDDSDSVSVSVGENAIPDSAQLQFDATQLSEYADGDTVDPLTDFVGAADAAAINSPTYKESVLNGNPIVRYNGSDNAHGTAISDISQPFSSTTVITNINYPSNLARVWGFNSSADNDVDLYYSDFADGLSIFAGNNLNTSSVPTEAIVTGIFDGSNSRIRINGTEITTGDAGTSAIQSIRMAADAGGNYLGYDLGEQVLYNTDIEAEGILSDEESRLSGKWGITI